MIIHIVKPMDSIWLLSKKYNVPARSILSANGLEPQGSLVLGQALIIPTPEKNNAYGYIEVNAFIQPSTREKEKKIIEESAEHLTYITPFSYHIQGDGTLLPIEDTFIINESLKEKVAPMLSITNLNESNFDTKLAHNLLTTPSLQQTLLNNINELLKTKGYYGVIFDIERIPAGDRQLYNDFLRKATKQLHEGKYVVATALAPKIYDIKEGSWHGAHDYKAHGEIVDFVIIMTYEWGWSGGAAQFKQ